VPIADYNPDDFNASNQSKVDEGLLVRFYIKARQDQRETQKQGKPVFKDVDYIEIRVPGQRNWVARPVTQADMARFPRHWEAYKNRTGNEEYLEGTLLAEWPLITRSQVEELSFANVKTVEQLVAMPDVNASQFMGINTLREKAKEWLARAKEGKAAAELEEKLAKRDDEIKELKEQVMALMKPKTKPRKKRVSKKKTSVKKKE
jgi:hypothetical protein